ncbi:MAG TPA: MFS transporter [Longimicrobium sp.]|nr:MFS transporter [Longimicrobium sp.]
MPAPAPRSALARFFAANVLFGSGLFAHGFLYNFYLAELNAGPAAMGAAAAALTAGGLAALAPAGILVDRAGPRRTYLLAALVAAAGLMAGAFAESLSALYAAAFVAGAGTAAWRVAIGPATLALASGPTQARAFSWNVGLLLASGAVWTWGAGAVPQLLGGGMPGVRAALAIGAGGTLLGGALFATLRLPAHAEARPSAETTSAPRLRGIVESLAVPAPVLARVALVALWMTAAALVIPFFNLYFQQVHRLPLSRIGGLMAAAQAVSAVAVFASGSIAARLGPARVLLGWVLLFGPAVWGMAGVAVLGPAIALYLVQGFAAPATHPLVDQLLLRGAPEDRRGAVSSWRNAATEGSGLAGAALGGVLLERTSFAVLFGVAGALGLAAGGALAASFLLRRGRFAVPAAVPRPEPAGAA